MEYVETKKKDLKILLCSIRHWEENVRALIYSEQTRTSICLTDYSISRHKCNCCFHFFEKICIGCPIYEISGCLFCESTPYERTPQTTDPATARLDQIEAAWLEVDYLWTCYYALGGGDE